MYENGFYGVVHGRAGLVTARKFRTVSKSGKASKWGLYKERLYSFKKSCYFIKARRNYDEIQETKNEYKYKRKRNTCRF